jgi:predicted aldo/keto reductase-like oxidoreductase
MASLPHRIPRRTFFGTAAGAVVALAGCKKSDAPSDAPKEGTMLLRSSPVSAASMPTRPLGNTGVQVSIVGIGGYHLGSVKSEAESIRIVRSALDRGVTFLDNCWDYHDGQSEERMGRALAGGYRKQAFLMTKLDGRTKKAAAEQLDQSLRRLGTDMIDLVQIHEVIHAADPSRCFAAGGCVEALVEARRAGKVRFIGFTGHKDPSIHLAMLKAADEHQFHFDTVQLPLNVMDAHYRSFEKLVLPQLVAKGIGVLGMKSLGDGKIVRTKRVSAVECLQYAMNLPTSVVITGCDSPAVLDQAIHAAVTFKPLPENEVVALLDRTKDLARNGKYETFKTTHEHDGTIEHPEWLESASIGS